MATEVWVERFQALRGDIANTDAEVQVFFKRRIDGHNIEGLEEHKFLLSQWEELKQLLNADFVLKLEERRRAALPAAGRTVPINHNSPEYHKAETALAKLEDALRETNEPLEPAERDQFIAEVSALRKMLNGLQARWPTVMTFAGATLLGIAYKFGDKLLGTLANAAFDAVKSLLM